MHEEGGGARAAGEATRPAKIFSRGVLTSENGCAYKARTSRGRGACQTVLTAGSCTASLPYNSRTTRTRLTWIREKGERWVSLSGG